MLNKNGWGLKEMLILSGVLMLFLVIAIYYIYRLYSSLDMATTDDYYVLLEDRLEEQVKTYLDNYYEDSLTSDVITISSDVLKAHDLDINLVDDNGDACMGYTLAYKSRGVTHIDSYIKCHDYVTDGYEEWREK